MGSTFLSDSATSDLSLMVAKNSLRQKRGREISAVEQLDFLRHLTGHTNFGLYVGKMINKVYLGIDEIGTVGAAVTISASSRTMPDVVFRVDTPFMFVIRHNPTKIPLFYGLVLDPTTTLSLPMQELMKTCNFGFVKDFYSMGCRSPWKLFSSLFIQ